MMTQSAPKGEVWVRIPWKNTETKKSVVEEWLEVLTLPIGWLYLFIHVYGGIYLWTAEDKYYAFLAVVIAFLLSAAIITILRWNWSRVCELNRDDTTLSLAVLIRFYTLTSIPLILIYVNIGLRYPHVAVWFWFASALFSLYFVFRPGSYREKFLKFFFIWPLESSEQKAEYSDMDRIDQIIWFLRFCVATIAIAGSKALWSKSLAYKISVSLGAGLHEETYKLLLTGTISMIPKYSRSRLAILYVAFVIGLSFDLTENVQYARTNDEPYILTRFFSSFAHSAFNFFIAIAISRQRDCIIWWVELLFGIIFAAGSHALCNYVAVSTESGSLQKLENILKTLLFYGTFLLLLTIRSAYPFATDCFSCGKPIETSPKSSTTSSDQSMSYVQL